MVYLHIYLYFLFMFCYTYTYIYILGKVRNITYVVRSWYLRNYCLRVQLTFPCEYCSRCLHENKNQNRKIHRNYTECNRVHITIYGNSLQSIPLPFLLVLC